MAVDVYGALKDLLDKIMGGDRQAALQFAEDPEGTLAAQGITDGELGQQEIFQLVEQTASEQENLSSDAKQSLQNYSSGGGGGAGGPIAPPPAHSGPASTADVVQHLNYVTYTTHEGDTQITQQLINNVDNSTNIDNSVDVDVDGDFKGDLDVTNVNATGDGAVAAGDDVTGVATGDGAFAAGDDIQGVATGDGAIAVGDDVRDSQLNTGDGAVLVGDDLEGAVNTGEFTGAQAGGDIDGPVNTGEFTGIQAGDDVENAVVGDNNQTANVSGEAENSTFNFGDGDVTNFGEADFDDTAVAVGGGDATNVSDNELDDGSALAVGGDADADFQETEIDVEAQQAVVNTEQGPGDQKIEDVENENEQEGLATI